MTGVSTLDRPPQPTAPTRYTVTLARDEADVRAAQRLRHDVFAGEMGALLATPQPGLDVDAFDAYCDHLLVRDDGDRAGRRHLPAAAAGARRGRRTAVLRERVRPRARSTRSAPASSRSAAPASTPTTATAPSSASSGPGSPATWWTAATSGWPAAAPSRSPTAARSPPATWDRVRAKHLAPEEYRVRPLLPWSPERRDRPAARAELPAAAARLPPPRRLGVRRSPPTTRTSGSPTCTCCCRCAGSTRAICGTSSRSSRPDERLAAQRALHPEGVHRADGVRHGRTARRAAAGGSRGPGARRGRAVAARRADPRRAGAAVVPVRSYGPPGSGSASPAPPRPPADCSWSPTTSPGWTSRCSPPSARPACSPRPRSGTGPWRDRSPRAAPCSSTATGCAPCRTRSPGSRTPLRDGGAVAVFPEGSTWCGRAQGHFRRAVFQAALDAGVPVQPVRLHYRIAGGTASTAPAFVGDDSLLASVWRVVSARGLVAEVEVRETIAPGSHPDRRSLAHAAQPGVTAQPQHQDHWRRWRRPR